MLNAARRSAAPEPRAGTQFKALNAFFCRGAGGSAPPARPGEAPPALTPGSQDGAAAPQAPRAAAPAAAARRQLRRRDGYRAGPAAPGRSLAAGRAAGGRATAPQQARKRGTGDRARQTRGAPPGSRGPRAAPARRPALTRPRRGRSASRPPGSSGGPAKALPATGAASCHSAVSPPIGHDTRVTRPQRVAMETAAGRPRPAPARRGANPRGSSRCSVRRSRHHSSVTATSANYMSYVNRGSLVPTPLRSLGPPREGSRQCPC